MPNESKPVDMTRLPREVRYHFACKEIADSIEQVIGAYSLSPMEAVSATETALSAIKDDVITVLSATTVQFSEMAAAVEPEKTAPVHMSEV